MNINELYWCGEKVADMSREKLLEVIMQLHQELEATKKAFNVNNQLYQKMIDKRN